MKYTSTWIAIGLSLGVAAAAGGSEAPAEWPAYLDYAYVYSSAEPAALQQRLTEYGKQTGTTLEEHIAEQAREVESEVPDETRIRRRAVAHLLHYLAQGEPSSLDASVATIRRLEDRLGRHENRYWYHYILAHRALEKGHRFDFVGETLDLWLEVVVPLETAYETLHTLSLSESPNSGFVSALPYIFENVARMVMIRSQQMGLDRDLDPLAAIVRLLHDGRVGSHPDVIPAAASSREYLDRIVQRLDGPESDAGSLTFTLALFEAGKHHDRARTLLASEGFGDETLDAIRMTSGAYQTALDRADTVQGQCAVYTRVLRQLGEVFAAKQRLEVDPEIELPFSIEGAIGVYGRLHRDGREDGWAELGYATTGRQSYIDAMHGLWEEIHEASLNTADYYLAQSLKKRHLSDEHSRNAVRLYTRYLAFFREFATEEGKEGVPDSAYFAAHEAAKGIGDGFLVFASNPTQSEIELAIRSYRGAMAIFPFDRELWPALTGALERQGRESEFLALARPAAESVTRSRFVNSWIENGESGANGIARLRRALSDTQAILYMGFANAQEVGELEHGLEELGRRREEVQSRLVSLRNPTPTPESQRAAADSDAAALDAPPAAPDPAVDPLERAERDREIAEASALLVQLDKQIAAASQALPLYKDTLETDGLAGELRSQRDHPVHTLLRRMYHEKRT